MLAHTSEQPAAACHCQINSDPEIFEPTVEALAEAMRSQFPNCTEETLQVVGFPLSFQRQHGDAARKLATKTFVRQLNTPEDRAGRVEKAANMAAGLVAHDAIATYLLSNGFRPRELGDIMPDVISRMCEIVVGQANEPTQMVPPQAYDSVSVFAETCIAKAEGDKVPAGQLYQHYAGWCEANRVRAVPQRSFGDRLQDLGFKKQRGALYYYLDVCLRQFGTRATSAAVRQAHS